MLTLEDFLNNGYKRFSSSNINYSEYGLQKCVSDGKGKKYHINVWVYDCSKYPKVDKQHWIRFAPDVQLSNKNFRFDTGLFQNDETTVSSIEQFYEDIWVKMECNYYELWD